MHIPMLNGNKPTDPLIYINFIQDTRQQLKQDLLIYILKRQISSFFSAIWCRGKEGFQIELFDLKSDKFYKSKLGATVTCAV